MSFPSVDEESLSSVYSSSSSFFGTVSRYSAAGNSPADGIPPALSTSSTRRETPKAAHPATTRPPRVIPTISPVLFRLGGGIPGQPGAPGAGAPHGWGACGYP